MLIIRQLENVDRLKHYLGDKVYKNLFPTEGNQVQPPKERVVTRILDGEIVGRVLEKDSQSKKAPIMDKALCPHPPVRDGHKVMIRGGNQSQEKKWWTCRDCHTRWERHAMSEMDKNDFLYDKHSIVTFGKYMGQPFHTVEKDPSYCKWVIATYETEKTMCEGLTVLAEYLLSLEWEKVKEAPKAFLSVGKNTKLTTEEKMDMELDDIVEDEEEEEGL